MIRCRLDRCGIAALVLLVARVHGDSFGRAASTPQGLRDRWGTSPISLARRRSYRRQYGRSRRRPSGGETNDRAGRSDDGRNGPQPGWITPLQGIASLGAGAIHAAAVGVHAEHPTLSRLFVAVAAAQILVGLATLLRGGRAGRCGHCPGQRRCRRRLDRHQGVGHLVDRGPRAVRGAAVRRHRLRHPWRVGGGRRNRDAARWGGPDDASHPHAARAAGDRPRRRHRRRHDVGRHPRSQQ